MARVLIGAAHTLENPGQVHGNLVEAELTRNILKKAVSELSRRNIEFKDVPLDLPLIDRIEWIKSTDFSEDKGDIFIEIHVNDGNKRGIESWFEGAPSKHNKSQILAETLNKEICEITGYANQGAHSELTHELGSLLIINQTPTIGTTIELLYIDNEDDIQILSDESKLTELANALVTAIEIYLKNTPTESSSKDILQQPSTTGQTALSPTAPFGSTTPSFTSTPTTQPSPSIMDKSERESMVKSVYKQIFDQEIEKFELNRLVNKGISKEQLFEELISSEKYKKLIQDSKDIDSIKKEKSQLENEHLNAKSKLTDQDKMMTELKKLLHYKNTYIEQIQKELLESGITSNGEYPVPQKIKNRSTSGENRTIVITKKFSLTEFIMRLLRL
jgi:hypothetical protein